MFPENSSLNQHDIESIVRQFYAHPKLQFQIEAFDVTPFSNSRVGYLGDHYTLKIRVRKDGAVRNAEELTFFCKILPQAIPALSQYLESINTFRKEVHLYGNLIPKLAEFARFAPRAYLSKGDRLLVLENLSLKGYRTVCAADMGIFDKAHLVQALQALARFHCASLMLEMKTGRPLPEFCPGALDENCWIQKENNPRVEELQNAIEVLCAMVKVIEKENENLPEILSKLPRFILQIYDLVKPSDVYRNTASHGDLWGSNLMFKYAESGLPEDCLIVDFQFARYAPPAYDVNMLITLTTTGQYRREHYSDLIESYYGAVRQELISQCLSPGEIFPKCQFMESCGRYHISGLIDNFLMNHVTLLPRSCVDRIFSSPNEYNNFSGEDKIRMCLKVLHNDEKYRARMTGIIKNLIDLFECWSRVSTTQTVSQYHSRSQNITMPNHHLNLTSSDKKQMLCKHFNDRSVQFEIISTSVTSLAEQRTGYLGDHFLLSMTVRVDSNQPDAVENEVKLFAKILPAQPSRAKYLEDTKAFSKEAELFESLLPLLHQFGRFAPEALFQKDGKLIVFRDVKTEGFRTLQHNDGLLDLIHLEQGLRVLARFHAASFALEAQQSKAIVELFPNILDENAWILKENYPRVEELDNIINLLCTVVAQYEKNNTRRKQLTEKIPGCVREIYELVKPSQVYRNVVGHGDLWNNNLMFRYSDTGAPIDCLLVDFQLSRYVPPAYDFNMLVTLTTTSGFRAKHLSFLQGYYYQSLRMELNRHGLSIEELVLQDEFRASCEHYQKAGAIDNVLINHVTLLPKNLLDDLFSSDEKYDKFSGDRKIEICLKVFVEDLNYHTRMIDMIENLVEVFKL
ncbi:uncharacterized protein LOC129772952 [Toxorhynchites rutilus septentrionalis]|uniref:uncharacterized protein LOC129772952 n=1 Tax=Toxorhynchites rutilus septentrionalis TaxID=329112 RepID=UPI002478B05E|nr:uncharacterized protein LOC129772952 [Toxorhynchites rutilus septentrionalis]